MKGKRRYLLWALPFLFVLALGAYWSNRGKAVTLVQANSGDMVQSIVTTGRVAMRSRSDIASAQNLRVDAVLVNEGDAVQAGQVLIRLHPLEARAASELAQAAVQEAQLRLNQVHSVQSVVNEQQLEQALAADRLAQQELERSRSLVAQGFVSASRLNEAERAARASQAAVKAALAQAQSSRSRGLEEQLASSRLAQAQANWKASQDRLAQTELRAPVAGLVLTRSVEVGDLAVAGRPLMVVVSKGTTQLHATVDEKNMKWLRLGQTALASVDADPTRPFQAKVVRVAPSVDPLRGTVEVKLDVEGMAAAWLKPDMTASIEIVVASAPNAIRVPSEAIVQAGSKEPTVWRVEDGRAHRTPVKLGLQGLGSTQVVSGVSAGDTLVAMDTSLVLAEGERVRAKAALASKALGTMPMPGVGN